MCRCLKFELEMEAWDITQTLLQNHVHSPCVCPAGLAPFKLSGGDWGDGAKQAPRCSWFNAG